VVNKMRETARRTLDPLAASVCMLAVALWTSGVLWFHLTRPAGAGQSELVFLIIGAPLFWGMTLLYAFRLPWSYPAGVLVLLGLLAGAIKLALDGGIYFSVSFYNLLTVGIVLIVLAGIVFGWRACRRDPARPLWQAALGIVGVVLVAGALAWSLSVHQTTVSRLNARWIMRRLKRTLADMETLEDKVAYLIAEGHLPSAAVGIVVDDELVWTGVYGEGTELDARYNAGSIAKPVVATAVLQLHDRGMIDLDADIRQYLPFEVRHPEHPDAPITPRMLLAHRSGLGHHTPVYFGYAKSAELLDWEEAYRGKTIYGSVQRMEDKPDYGVFLKEYLTPGGRYYVPRAWGSQKPGTAYRYSTVGYDVLGYLVEEVSGQPVPAYLEENILKPLGMIHTDQLVVGPSAATAFPHERVYGVFWKTNVELPAYGNERIGGGGLSTTVPDLARFMIAHMNEGRVGDIQILDPETVALMHAPAVKTSTDIGMAASGYGWAIRREEPWSYWGYPFEMRGAQGHGGGDYGYRAGMYYVQKEGGGYGAIMLTNLANFFKEDMPWYFGIYLQLEDLLMDEAQTRWAAKH
jgi:CubicO group peptidase (beta-lactamase class C family)